MNVAAHSRDFFSPPFFEHISVIADLIYHCQADLQLEGVVIRLATLYCVVKDQTAELAEPLAVRATTFQ